MKVFDSEKIRNVTVVGHGDTGKTTLVSAILYTSGTVNRFGRVEEGNTVTDYDDDEIDRRITINTALAHCEWKGHKINLLDTPGYSAFIQDAKSSMMAAEAALLLIDATSGVEVQTEWVWDFAREYQVPRMIVVNKLDRDNSSFERAVEGARNHFGREVVPIQIPIGSEQKFSGVFDLIRNKAFVYEWDGDGTCEVQDAPEELKEQIEARREELMEMIAESDDALMEKYFETGELSEEEMVRGLAASIAKSSIFPVLCCSASHNIGVRTLLDAVVELAPTPLHRPEVQGTNVKTGEAKSIRVDADGPAAAFVFKTLADPFAGRISLVKVYSGVLKSDSTLRNLNKDTDERMGSLQVFQGKSHESIPEVKTGDLCGVLKLKETTTGDTLAANGFGTTLQRVLYPEPSISFAVEPASRGDEEKMGSSVARIMEEDPSLRFTRDPQTKEFLLSGTGQLHIEVSVGKLKKKYGVQVVLRMPKVPYRETIVGSSDVHGRHKKQSGGHGQFGDCRIKMEPLSRGEGFLFEDAIFGGSIPKQYIPAVEKGIVEAADKGFLAGFPVVDFKVILYDGSYHEVDSSEMAFKIAGSLAFRKGMEQAKPVLLEPIMNVEVFAPEENAGDIMGDLNSRRGRILGMDIKGTTQVVRAQVPLAEMLNYQPTLTSMTGGRGSYHMESSHYDIVPHNIAEKVIEEARRLAEEERK